MQSELDVVLKAGIAAGAVPGVVVQIVDRDGVIYSGAAGERRAGSGVAMTTDTVGAIFSMTKALTGAAAMQLVEAGRVDLDAPAGNYVDELDKLAHVLEGFGVDGLPITRPAVGTVTLRNLLTHTSGYVYEVWNGDLARWYEATGTAGRNSGKLAGFETPLAFDPGTRWQYGIGIDWAGIVVERVSGLRLGAYFAEHLTGPLAMNDTAYAHTDTMFERAATLHARKPDGTFRAFDLARDDGTAFQGGGGGLYSTMDDYGRFIRMILRDGELDGVRVLAPETVATMAQNHIGDLRVSELKSQAPRLSNDAELFADVAKSWGLSFQIHEADGETGCPAGTLSWAGLANSCFWIDRVNGVGGCFLTQLLPFADAGAVELFYDVQRTVYANAT